ncbi:PiggyBac transposable element-derived protein 3 [Trichinella patagoniensis]|uniref:PiggyBac transposable element-derived protein 3 n=1 Tax=Trichinella patagoniensis TaxID=990121 RepID=A0A0V0Z6Z3_9BILA|nr:PiggyBac transposable element-derived protein 3 [Trichinella patagoniensis]
MPVDEAKKKHRGFFDHVCNGTVYVCRWNDNAVVTLASNHLTHHPTGSVQRYSQSQKKHVKIRMPEILRRYNTSMGGVDISDKLLSSYRPRLKSKKFWWNLFSNALNLAAVSAWTRKIPIMPVDEVKKKHRGFFDHVCNGTVYVCRWNNNAVVTLASNHLTHHPIGSVQRYSQSQKKHASVEIKKVLVEFILKCTEPCCCLSLVITQGIAPREFHCPVTSGFQKRYHNTFSPSKTSANHSDWTKSISTRNLENK